MALNHGLTAFHYDAALSAAEADPHSSGRMERS
jgi:hypothetical protein